MKFLLKITLSGEKATAAIRDGSMMEKMQRIFEEIKPEAAYFTTENGCRTQYLVINMDSPMDLPAVGEPWWLTFDADVSIMPAFTLQEIESLGPALEGIVKKFGQE